MSFVSDACVIGKSGPKPALTRLEETPTIFWSCAVALFCHGQSRKAMVTMKPWTVWTWFVVTGIRTAMAAVGHLPMGTEKSLTVRQPLWYRGGGMKNFISNDWRYQPFMSHIMNHQDRPSCWPAIKAHYIVFVHFRHACSFLVDQAEMPYWLA